MFTCLEGDRRHRQTSGRRNRCNSPVGCCRFVTDESRAQIGYRFRRSAFDSERWFPVVSEPTLDAETVLRSRGDCGGYRPRCRNQSRGRAAARTRQGQPYCQCIVRARQRRPQHQPDLLFRPDAGKAETIEPAGTPLHRARDRPPVRRLSGSRLCGCTACGHVAAQYPRHRILLSGGKVAARPVRAATLHFRKLYPCIILSAGARAQRRHPIGGKARGRWRRALQSELQYRYDARRAARPRRGAGIFQADRSGQFRTAIHARPGRFAGGRIQRDPR